MEAATDTVLITVYCLVDDLYRTEIAHHRPRWGRPPVFSDSEVLTLVLLAQRAGCSERAFLQQVRERWAAFFPHLPTQSTFNRRARSLVGALAALVPLLDAQLHARVGPAPYEILDGVAMPVLRRCRGERHRLFGSECAFGRGGSDRDWYYGLKVLIAGTSLGSISGFVAGPANTEERWLAEGLLRWRIDPTLPDPTAEQLAPVLGDSHRLGGKRKGPSGPLNPPLGVGTPVRTFDFGDSGFAGAGWQAHWQVDYGTVVLTPADIRAAAPNEDVKRRWSRGFSRCRHGIERINSSLVNALHLAYCGARSYVGLLTRLAAKLAAHNISLLANLQLGRPLHAWLPAL